MRSLRSAPLAVLATFASLTLALPLAAARLSDDALSLVPPDAASVGVVRLNDLRTSPLSARLFSETDRMTVDGDGARFLEEARLNAREDVDTIVVAGSPKGDKDGTGLVAFEGRFDPERLSAAVVARGAVKMSTPNGDYYQLPEHHGDVNVRKRSGAVAFVSSHLVVAGTEDAVVQALARRANRAPGFAAGAGLGRHLSRIDSGASAWAIVDASRLPFPKTQGKAHIEGEINGRQIGDVIGAMKSVSLVTLQATVKGESVRLSATGLIDDDETRELIEDTLRGAMAAWRLAVQDKNPDMVSVIRKFKVARDKDSVSISGTLPGAAVRAMMDHERRGEQK